MAWKASLASKSHWTQMCRLGDLPKFFNWQQQKRDMNRKNKNITNSKPFANFKLSELIMGIGKKNWFFGTCVYLDLSNIPNNLTFSRQSWVCPWMSCWVTWFASAAMRRTSCCRCFNAETGISDWVCLQKSIDMHSTWAKSDVVYPRDPVYAGVAQRILSSISAD